MNEKSDSKMMNDFDKNEEDITKQKKGSRSNSKYNQICSNKSQTVSW